MYSYMNRLKTGVTPFCTIYKKDQYQHCLLKWKYDVWQTSFYSNEILSVNVSSKDQVGFLG